MSDAPLARLQELKKVKKYPTDVVPDVTKFGHPVLKAPEEWLDRLRIWHVVEEVT